MHTIALLVYCLLGAVFITGIAIIISNVIKIKRSGMVWKKRSKNDDEQMPVSQLKKIIPHTSKQAS